MKPFRLLIVISSFPAGQHVAGLFLPGLVGELARLGCEVRVLTQNCEGRRTETRRWHGCEVTFFGWNGGFTPLVSVLSRGPQGALLAAQYLASGVRVGCRLTRAWRPDFILAEWLIPAGLVALAISRLCGVPYAARALGSDVMVAGRKRVMRMILGLVARRAGLLFADGFDLCRRTSALAGGKPCLFAATGRPLGPERSDFNLPPASTPSAPDERPRLTVCVVGRLHRSKGQDVLVEALARLKAQGRPARAYLVGVGEERDALARQIDTLGLTGEAILTGRLEDGDIAELLARVDCAVIPSRSESIPLVLREAVAAGKPVVVTDVGDMGDLVRRYGLGRVVPPEDPAALAEAIAATCAAPAGPAEAQRDQLLELLSTGQAARTMLDAMRAYLARKAGERL